jgi:hypothetical protein
MSPAGGRRHTSTQTKAGCDPLPTPRPIFAVMHGTAVWSGPQGRTPGDRINLARTGRRRRQCGATPGRGARGRRQREDGRIGPAAVWLEGYRFALGTQ